MVSARGRVRSHAHWCRGIPGEKLLGNDWTLKGVTMRNLPTISITVEDAAKRVRYLGITRADIEKAVRFEGTLTPILLPKEPLRVFISELDEWAASKSS